MGQKLSSNVNQGSAALAIMLASKVLAFALAKSVTFLYDVGVYGHVAAVMAMSALLASVLGLGYHRIIEKKFAQSKTPEIAAAMIKKRLRAIFTFYWIACPAATTILFVWSSTAGRKPISVADAIIVCAFGIYLLTTNCYWFALRGSGAVLQSMWSSQIMVPGLTILLLFVTSFLAPEASIASVFLAYMFARLFDLLLSCRSYPRPNRERLAAVNDHSLRKDLKEVYYFSLMTIATTFSAQFGVLFARQYFNDVEVGEYALAFTVASIASFGLVAINQISARQFARASVAGNRQALRHGLWQTRAFAMLISLPVGLVFYMYGYQILEFLAGAPIGFDRNWFLTLVAANIIGCLAGGVGMLLTMCGHEKVVAQVTVVSAVTQFFLAYFLIPAYGMFALCIAFLVAGIMTNVILTVIATLTLNSVK